MPLSTLRRYLAGASPDEEHRRVDAWARESAARRRYLNALRTLLAQSPRDGAAQRSAAWGRLSAKLDRPAATAAPEFRAPWDGPAVHVPVRDPRPRVLAGAFGNRRSGWAVPLMAAAALAMAAGGLRLIDASASGPVPAPTAMRRVATTRGQRAEVRLDDGTQVELGVDSHLEFPADFGAQTRDVYLEGTAYFHVVHDTTKPFTVHTANAVTRDVGTRFVVRAYSADHSTAVVVTEGSVALGTPGAATDSVLTRNQLGVLRAGASSIAVSAVDPAAYTAWMHGQLVFRDAPLASVVRELGRWYSTQIRIGDSTLAAMPFSASFDAESVREAIATLTTVLPVRAVRRGKVVVLERESE